MSKAFSETLKEVREGGLAIELAEKLGEVLAAVKATGKGGSLTLKLSVKPIDGTANQILITDDVKVALPEPSKQATVMFVTEENELSRRDPRQPQLPMGVVRPMAERSEASQ